MRSGTKYLRRTWPWWCCLRCWLQTGTSPPPSWAAAGSPQCGKIWHTLPHRSATLSVPHNDLPHTPGAAPAVSPETHTAQIWLTHCWRQIFESASWKLQSILCTTNIKIYTTKKCMPCTPPQVGQHSRCRVGQSCTTIMSSRGAIIGAHCHPPWPGASPIVHQFQRSQEISAGFCISQRSDWICGNCTADPSRFVSQSIWEKDSCCVIMWSSKFNHGIKHFFLTTIFPVISQQLLQKCLELLF